MGVGHASKQVESLLYLHQFLSNQHAGKQYLTVICGSIDPVTRVTFRSQNVSLNMAGVTSLHNLVTLELLHDDLVSEEDLMNVIYIFSWSSNQEGVLQELLSCSHAIHY